MYSGKKITYRVDRSSCDDFFPSLETFRDGDRGFSSRLTKDLSGRIYGSLDTIETIESNATNHRNDFNLGADGHNLNSIWTNLFNREYHYHRKTRKQLQKITISR